MRDFVPKDVWTKWDDVFASFFEKYESRVGQATRMEEVVKSRAERDRPMVQEEAREVEKPPPIDEKQLICCICNEGTDLFMSKCGHLACK